MTQRCGFVTVIGTPNAGKSTLVNALVGGKVSIVSSKVQTTRMPVRGIVVHEESQIIFTDTPGIFTPRKKLERAMVASAQESRKDVDVIMLVVDASKQKIDENTKNILSGMQDEKKEGTRVLILNKTDKIKPEKLLPLAQEINGLCPFDATFMVSALKNDGIPDILRWVAERMPEGSWHYSPDMMSDMPARMLAAEITREKLFEKLHEELPYGLMVATEGWDDDGNNIRAEQTIFVSSETHRPIVLGKNGLMIKEIGIAARREMEDIFDCRVHLNLFVKVAKNWADNPEYYRSIGLGVPE